MRITLHLTVALAFLSLLSVGCEDLFEAVVFGGEACVEGTITDAEGIPVQGAKVTLSRSCWGLGGCSCCGIAGAKTDAHGRYKVEDYVGGGDDCSPCSECDWTLSVEASGYRSVDEEYRGRCFECVKRDIVLVRQ